MKKQIIAAIAAIAILGGGYAAYQNQQKPAAPAPSAQQTATTAPEAVKPVSYKGVEGKNALELLQASHDVQVKQYSFGPMVTSIDDTASTDKMGWIFYINGTSASVGAQDYITKPSDTLEWRYESTAY